MARGAGLSPPTSMPPRGRGRDRGRAGAVETAGLMWRSPRAEERLIWVTRYMLSKPQAPLGIEDLKVPAAPLKTGRAGGKRMKAAIVTGASAGIGGAPSQSACWPAGWHVGPDRAPRRSVARTGRSLRRPGRGPAARRDGCRCGAGGFPRFRRRGGGGIDCLFNNAGKSSRLPLPSTRSRSRTGAARSR